MSEENGWVKLPAGCPWLPEGTRILYGIVRREHVAVAEVHQTGAGRYRGRFYRVDDQHTSGDATMSPEVIQGVILPSGYRFSGLEVVKEEADDLGDTPDHLRELLREIRREVPGAVVWDDGSRCPMVIHPDGKWRHMSILNLTRSPPQTKFEPVKGGGYERIGKEIREGRVYPTADARRIGREEFGMVFEGELKPMKDVAKTLQREEDVWIGAGEKAVLGPTKVLTSPITWGDEKTNAHALAEALQEAIDKHIVLAGGGPGVIKSGSVVYKGRTVGPASTHRVCACGSTTNVNLRLGVCAECHLEKRKAEVRAGLDRKVPESKAPKGWPEQFSGSSWEE